MEKLCNCCPHDIHIYRGDSEVMVIPQSGIIARVQIAEELDRTVQGIPVYRKIPRKVRDLPDPERNTTFIVSSMVLDVAKRQGRTDVVAPDTTCRSVRTQDKMLLGVTCFRI